MNIWAWVEQSKRALHEAGHHRLADLVERFPDDVVSLRHEQVEAQLPEAIALARQLRQPWLELFVRHWSLQSRVFWRLEGEHALGEATQLLEFAHRDENLACPQSVCVTQDLAACYGRVDGPGYAEARIAVSDESLQRITPSWTCFSCLSTERASAMLDAGQAAEALAFLDRQAEAARGVAPGFPMDTALTRGDILSALGRHEEALELAEELERRTRSSGRKLNARLLAAWQLATLGRADEALQTLPGFEQVKATPGQFLDWARAARALVTAGGLANDSTLHRRLGFMAQQLETTGSWSTAWQIHEVRVQLALRRGWRELAGLSLAAMQLGLEHFRLRGPREVTLAAYRGQVDALPHPAAVDDEAAVLSSLPTDAAEGLERLAPFVRAHPDSTQAAVVLSDALVALGQPAEAEALLLAGLRSGPASEQVLGRLVRARVEAGKTGAARELVEQALAEARDDERRVLAHQLLASIARSSGDSRERRRHLEALCRLAPEARLFTTLAELEREAGEVEAAFARATAAVERWPEPGPHHWELMVSGTLLRRWDAVRGAWRAMGERAEGEGPFEEDFGLVRVRLPPADGNEVVFARRLGPVTARVLTLPGVKHVNRLEDVVVLDGTRLDEPDDASEAPEDEREPPLLSAVATLDRGQCFVFTIEGVSPGAEVLQRVSRALRGLGVRVAIFSDDYELTLSDGTTLAGAYVRVGVPPRADVVAVAHLLGEQLRSESTPLFWPLLLEHLGRQAEATDQRERGDELGLDLDPPVGVARSPTS